MVYQPVNALNWIKTETWSVQLYNYTDANRAHVSYKILIWLQLNIYGIMRMRIYLLCRDWKCLTQVRKWNYIQNNFYNRFKNQKIKIILNELLSKF